MNVYDTVRMQDCLAPLGYEPVDSHEGADLVILNTCHIREKAEEKVYSELGRIRNEKKQREEAGESMLIAVGGCVGQAEGAEIMRRAPYVDMVMGPQSYHQLPEMVARASRKKGAAIELDFPQVQKFDLLPETTSAQGITGFLSVQEGCDKFCTFCVVPYTRGGEYSRPLEAILEEAKRMVDHGTADITLLGQNVNAYHGDFKGRTASLAEVITEVAKINGVERIRYTTSHPRDMTDDLIAVHGDEKKLMPYLHLPVQSGSDAILKKMNRKHDAAFYIDIVERLRAKRPDLSLSSDFIVGFPGETDKDFEATMQLVRTVQYGSAFSFSYSQRPGTPAATDEAQVDEAIKHERLMRLQALIRKQTADFHASCVGKTLDVLFEKEGKYEGQIIGKSGYLQAVHAYGPKSLLGTVAKVTVHESYTNSLAGNIVGYAPPHPDLMNIRKAS